MDRGDAKKNGHTRRTTPARPSISEVAAHAGVSIATVSRIMNGITNKASEETVKRVQKSVRELGYRPSSAGQALRRRESRIVSVIASNLANPVMSAIAASVEVSLRKKGLVMVLCDSHEKAELQDEYLREMRAHSVRGFVMLGAVASPVLADLLDANETVLFVNRANPIGPTPAFVGLDNKAAARDVAKHFLDKGLLRPLLIHSSLGSSATADRVAAFEECFSRHGNANVVIRGEERLDHLRIGFDLMNQHLDECGASPDAVFALSDLIAYGAARAIRERGFPTIPIVGFDDNPLNDWVAPWLTTIGVPYTRFGDSITEALERLWRKESGFSICLPHKMVVRNGHMATDVKI